MKFANPGLVQLFNGDNEPVGLYMFDLNTCTEEYAVDTIERAMAQAASTVPDPGSMAEIQATHDNADEALAALGILRIHAAEAGTPFL